MRIEVSDNYVDVWASKDGAINLGIGAFCFLILLALVGFNASVVIAAVSVTLVLPVAWWQHRHDRPETATPASPVGLRTH